MITMQKSTDTTLPIVEIDKLRLIIDDYTSKIKFWAAIIIGINLLFFVLCLWPIGYNFYLFWDLFSTSIMFTDAMWSWIIWIYSIVYVITSVCILLHIKKIFADRESISVELYNKKDEIRKKRYNDTCVPETIKIMDRQRDDSINYECEKIAFKPYGSIVQFLYGCIFSTITVILSITFLYLQSPSKYDESSTKVIIAGTTSILSSFATIIAHIRITLARKDKMLVLLLQKDNLRSALIIADILYKDGDKNALSTIVIDMAKNNRT